MKDMQSKGNRETGDKERGKQEGREGKEETKGRE